VNIKNHYSTINEVLYMFCLNNISLLPELFTEDSVRIMIDTIPIFNSNQVLPVVVRSTGWLKGVNNVKSLPVDDLWLTQPRFEAIPSVSAFSFRSRGIKLLCFLESEILLRKEDTHVDTLLVSERALDMLEDKSRLLILPKIELIKLPQSYTDCKIQILG